MFFLEFRHIQSNESLYTYKLSTIHVHVAANLLLVFVYVLGNLFGQFCLPYKWQNRRWMLFLSCASKQVRKCTILTDEHSLIATLTRRSPIPDEPRNKKTSGCSSSPQPFSLLRMAAAAAVMGPSCPTIASLNLSSRGNCLLSSSILLASISSICGRTSPW